uniref:glycosyltransferase n=1 Tax=Zavarzinella formosa TaxID=360055 RepID=UPI0012FA2709
MSDSADPPETVSIIILCHNELAFTRLCLESVRRHTTPPYELILVDNGSTDGTIEHLAAFAARPGPGPVVIHRNQANAGYPAGVNHGLRHAAGELIVLLNNDVVVTPDWIDRLRAWAKHDHPATGLVGVMTNNAPPPQRIAPGYDTLAGLDDFARRWQQDHLAEAVRVPRLTGFCLLVRAEVFRKIGTLDERFGHGFFDDDDLCLRARRAGFQLLLARDVYVHHFGSQTFKGLGIDTAAQLDRNLSLYRDKWGAEEASKYRLPDSPKPAPKVSLTMIVKNEERHLPDCLASVHDLVDEIIIADTGSTDRTREIAASFGARVIEFPWIDDFAAARNAALEQATGDWVFWMDADDRLDEANRGKFRDLIRTLDDKHTARVMKCHCLGDRPGSATTVDHVRLFRRLPGVRWKYRVHEQILPSVRATGGGVEWADITVTHVGYADPAARARKLDRDRRLLLAEREQQPDDPFTLFNLGSVYDELGQPELALPCLRRSLELSNPRDSIVRKLHAMIAQCHRRLKSLPEAAEAIAAGRADYPDDAELLFLDGLARRDRG